MVGAETPPVPLLDLAYVRRRVPQHAVFYDLPRAEHVEFSSMKDVPVTDSHDRDVVPIDEEEAFNADQWKVSKKHVNLLYLICKWVHVIGRNRIT